MDVYKTMTSMNRIGKYLIMLMVLLNLATLAIAADTGTQNIANAMKELCHNAQMLLGGAALILIVLAAVVYAIGQITGAETRARASVWATAMIIGALVGIAIYLLIPSIIRTLIPQDQLGAGFSYGDGSDPCAFAVN
ncbi:MAG: hypothetical protein ABII22_06940 [Candidatus Micrarchaeota archaeon]